MSPTAKLGWNSLYALVERRWVAALLRLFVDPERLPTVESNFVIQRLQALRADAWRDYQSARYGDGRGCTKFNAYLERVSNAKVAKPGATPVISPELDAATERPLRIRWLELTEALAECWSFTNPEEIATNREDEPQLLHSAELLAAAGAVQHEIANDLRRCTVDQGEEGQHRVEGEFDLALHFFELSASCLEAHLEPKSVSWWGRTRRDRSTHFGAWSPVGRKRPARLNGESGSSKPTSEAEHASRSAEDPAGSKIAVDRLIHYTLLRRYELLDLWEWKLGQSKSIGGNGPPIPAKAEIPDDGADGVSLDLELARIAAHAADASLALELGQSGHVGALNGHGRRVESQALDKLVRANELIARCEKLAREDDADEQRIWNAIDGLIHLWGLSIEQDLNHLHAGSEVWYERCEEAASLYRYAGSLRVRRLAAIVEAVESSREEEEIIELK